MSEINQLDLLDELIGRPKMVIRVLSALSARRLEEETACEQYPSRVEGDDHRDLLPLCADADHVQSRNPDVAECCATLSVSVPPQQSPPTEEKKPVRPSSFRKLAPKNSLKTARLRQRLEESALAIAADQNVVAASAVHSATGPSLAASHATPDPSENADAEQPKVASARVLGKILKRQNNRTHAASELSTSVVTASNEETLGNQMEAVISNVASSGAKGESELRPSCNSAASSRNRRNPRRTARRSQSAAQPPNFHQMSSFETNPQTIAEEFAVSIDPVVATVTAPSFEGLDVPGETSRALPSIPVESAVVMKPLSHRPDKSIQRHSAQRHSAQNSKKIQSATGKTGSVRRATSSEGVSPDPLTESYAEWFRRVALNHRCTTWFTTFYLHWILVLALAVLIVQGPDSPAALLITATFSEPEQESGGSFEIAAEQLDVREIMENIPAPASAKRTALEERNLDISYSILDNMSPDGEKPPKPKPLPLIPPTPEPEFPDPAPPDAVTRGSFSVWTEPRIPKAGMAYRIMVQIRLPKGVDEYDWSDLQGMVVGSDGYRKPIPPFQRGKVASYHGYIRFSVPIVSADQQVRDTVYVRSKLLKETQELRLQF